MKSALAFVYKDVATDISSLLLIEAAIWSLLPDLASNHPDLVDQASKLLITVQNLLGRDT